MLMLIWTTREAFLRLSLFGIDKRNKTEFIIVDSLQTAASDIPGGKLEREVEAVRMLLKWAKETGGTVFVIGMVTKEEDFAGSQEAMQLVDAHLHLTFDKKANERYLEFQQKTEMERFISDYTTRSVKTEKVSSFGHPQNGWCTNEDILWLI